jgi:hypothetical protein
MSWVLTGVMSVTKVDGPMVMYAYDTHDNVHETSHGRNRGFESRIADRRFLLCGCLTAAVELRPVAEVADLADAVVDELAVEIAAVLPGATVEHVGATALRDGLTKGDVDVAISVPEQEFAGAVARLRQQYDTAQPDHWTDTYASFSINDKALPTAIQVAVAGSTESAWNRKRTMP